MLELLLDGADRLGLTLTPEQVRQFKLYYEDLVDWNKRVNLTAITSYEEVQLKHFLDSLTIVPVLGSGVWAKRNPLFIDVGTGGGIPGIPLKIVLPEARVVLLDSVAKKTAFVQHMVNRLGLEQVQVLTARAEDIAHQPGYREMFDLVVCRAVSKLATIAELTLPLCKKGGIVVAPKKGEVERELSQATKAIDILGGKLREIRKVDLKDLDQHLLVILNKVLPTPSKYPRRAGMPAKHPL